ncbi:MAG TPA: MFS transporter, partial [Ohtaekwangia sp.]|nr:MFS transporter [Ohtaekwangia sp.]
MENKSILKQVLRAPVIIAALGYFVDIYDLLLFSIVRVPSLQALGLSGDELLKEGIYLINIQMAGLLTGGILWGILGDKRGRLSVLFGSILLYSLANITN